MVEKRLIHIWMDGQRLRSTSSSKVHAEMILFAILK